MDIDKKYVNRKLDNEIEIKLNVIGELLAKYVDQGVTIYNELDVDQLFNELKKPIPALFMQALNLLDAIAILSKNGQADGMKSSLRSLFEASLNLIHLIRSPTQQGVIAYQVSHTHREMKLRQLLDSETIKGKEFQKEWSKLLPNEKLISIPIEDSTKNLQIFLERPEIKPVDEEWKRTKKIRKRDPEWYGLYGGPTNLRALSQRLSLGLIYDVLYADLSGHVHASTSLKRFQKGSYMTDALTGIINVKDIQILALNSLYLMDEIFQNFIATYKPSYKDHYTKWYERNILKAHEKLMSNQHVIKVNDP